MPGKVNPTQNEALSMVCAQIIGNNAAMIAKKDHNENKTLCEAALESALVTDEQFTLWVDAKKM